MIAASWQRYWFEFSVLRRRMVLWRVVFFGLLAVDFWTILLEHAPRFGAGGFNVSQLPWLDRFLPLPTPEVVGPLYVVGGLLATCIALGIAPRRCLTLLAPVYAGVYFWSQSDSYQHHYLISLLLVLLTAVPEAAWTLPRPGEPTHVQSWAMRLVYVQIGLMYAWTAVTKHTPVWLDGTTLDQIVACEPREQLRAAATWTGGTLNQTMAWAATVVMIGEYIAGLVYLARPLWVVGLFLIPTFHLGVEWLRLDIELFSYYMVGTNVVLLMPERWLLRMTDAVARRSGPVVRAHAWSVKPRPISAGAARAQAGAVGALLFAVGATVPFEGATRAGVALAFAAMAILWPFGDPSPHLRRMAVGLLVGGAALWVTVHATDTAYTYYRQWGGFLRRQGDDAGAREMYEKANAAAGDAPARHLQLARLLARGGDAAGAAALVDEDIRRQQKALTGARAAPQSADEWLARGKTARALADALGYAAELGPKAGRAFDAAENRRQRDEAIRLAKEAFQKNVSLSPACGVGRTELARMTADRGGDAGGEN